MKALIDGDIVVYRCAASAEHDEVWAACARAQTMIEDILADTEANCYKVYLTGSNNFRRELDPTYKANRPDTRPKHWLAVREFLVTQHGAEVCNGYEADDAMGMNQQMTGTIICSIDKDMLQVPGQHWNFVKKERSHITEQGGLRRLYTQTLVGDRSDNIFGVAGIGPVKADKVLRSASTEDELYHRCLELYGGDEKRLRHNLALLYVWRKPNDVWYPPEGGAEATVEAPTGGDATE